MTCGSDEDPRYQSKDPNSILDYEKDWASPEDGGPWLKDGDTIATSTWEISTIPDDPSPLAVNPSSPAPSHTDTTATIWLKGGTLGKDYTVTNRVTTTQGRTEDDTFYFNIANH